MKDSSPGHLRRSQWIVEHELAPLHALPATNKHQPQVLDAVEVKDLLAAIEGDRLRPLFVTTMALGLRPSEGFGLLWKNIDLDAGTVSIGRTSQYVEKAYHYGTGKTEESAAELALPGFVADLLVSTDSISGSSAWRTESAGATAASSVRTRLAGTCTAPG